MRTRFTHLILAIVTAVAVVAADQNDTARTLLEAARKTAVVDGNLTAAIRQYAAIVETYSKSDRATVADALVRMAECYEKLGDTQARKIYERVVREFSDQTGQVALARVHLGRGERSDGQRAIALRKVWTGDISGAVSTDGRYMTYVDNFNTALVLRDLTTGADRPLTREVAATFGSAISKDSTQVAYNWCQLESCEVRVASLQGTGVPVSRRVFGNDEVFLIAPRDWSPDGKWLAVSLQRKDRTAQLGVIAVADGALRVLKSVDWRGTSGMFFSPDGRDIAFDLPVSENSSERDVFVLAADGSREVTAVTHPGNDRVMGWTPDGTHLLFASDRSGALGLWAQAFAERKPQGAPQLIKPDIGNVKPLGVTRSGALYLGVDLNTQDIDVASIDLATGKQTAAPTRLIQRSTGFNSQPTWSHDGKSLAYHSRRTDSIGIRSMDTGQITELQLRPSLAYFQGLSWAPDGQSFAVFGGDLKGRDGIFRIDALTGDVTPIAAPIAQADRPSYEGFFWSPDGKRLYYHSQNGTIHERDLASGTERVVHAGRPSPIGVTPPDGRLGEISLSPDGRWIASYRSEASRKSAVLVLIPVNGGEPRDLLRVNQPERVNNSSMPWTPDGRSILVRKNEVPPGTSELWLVPIDGAPPRKLEFDANRVVPYSQGKIRLHPDGRQIAFVSGPPYSSEVWVLENFLPALKARR